MFKKIIISKMFLIKLTKYMNIHFKDERHKWWINSNPHIPLYCPSPPSISHPSPTLDMHPECFLEGAIQHKQNSMFPQSLPSYSLHLLALNNTDVFPENISSPEIFVRWWLIFLPQALFWELWNGEWVFHSPCRFWIQRGFYLHSIEIHVNPC